MHNQEEGAVVSLVEMLLMGVALSADAFAVTVSNAVAHPHAPRARLLLMPVMFGAFQALMPALGYLLGSAVSELVERYAGIVTLLVMAYIGGSMIWEGYRELHGVKVGANDVSRLTGEKDDAPAAGRTLGVGSIVVQAISTSIDAFAVGVSLLAIGASLQLACPVIGLTTFVICLVGLVIGRRFGEMLGARAEIAGGIVLLAIGIKSMFFA